MTLIVSVTEPRKAFPLSQSSISKAGIFLPRRRMTPNFITWKSMTSVKLNRHAALDWKGPLSAHALLPLSQSTTELDAPL